MFEEIMTNRSSSLTGAISRRSLLGTAAAIAATPALAEGCQVGPPSHEKGPKVWMDMDQVELDAAYDQTVYAPMIGQFQKRFASSSETTRKRIGAPKRFAYGPTPIEGSMSIRPNKPMRRSSLTSMAGDGGMARLGIMATRPISSSMRA
jgi:hypothetical protein